MVEKCSKGMSSEFDGIFEKSVAAALWPSTPHRFAKTHRLLGAV